MSDNAVHIDHGINHSASLVTEQLGMGIGLGLGILAGVVAGFGAGGPVGAVLGGIALANTGAQLGSWLGGIAGSYIDDTFGKMKTGWLTSGASSVFLGKENKPVARIEDKAVCPGGVAMQGAAMALSVLNPAALVVIAIGNLVDQLEGQSHSNPVVAEGVLHIHVEGFNAARVGCKTTCAALICEGEPSVFFHGELGRLEGYEVLEENEGLDDTLWWFDWVGNIAELVAAIEAAIVGGSALLVFLAGVAAMATLAKLLETITGEKMLGFLDDGSYAYAALANAVAAYRRTPGSAKAKALAFTITLAAELVDNPNGGAKVLKRIHEMMEPPPVVRREIPRKRF